MNFNPYTAELVDRLTKLGHAESRTWFALIRDHLRRNYGVDSLHDFIAIECDEAVRWKHYETLGLICHALRENNRDLLTEVLHEHAEAT